MFLLSFAYIHTSFLLKLLFFTLGQIALPPHAHDQITQAFAIIFRDICFYFFLNAPLGQLELELYVHSEILINAIQCETVSGGMANYATNIYLVI